MFIESSRYTGSSLWSYFNIIDNGSILWRYSNRFYQLLQSSKWKITILAVVVRLTKYNQVILLASTSSTQQVAEILVIGVIRLHNPPHTIITYRNPRFPHSFLQEKNHLQSSRLYMSTTYHLQTDKLYEALNKRLEQYLCFYFLCSNQLGHHACCLGLTSGTIVHTKHHCELHHLKHCMRQNLQLLPNIYWGELLMNGWGLLHLSWCSSGVVK